MKRINNICQHGIYEVDCEACLLHGFSDGPEEWKSMPNVNIVYFKEDGMYDSEQNIRIDATSFDVAIKKIEEMIENSTLPGLFLKSPDSPIFVSAFGTCKLINQRSKK